jgi:DNA-binding transcriptional LysR family regulator
MTIKQLEYFMAIAQSLNFSEAAKRLYISQPALSRSISSLEEELKVPLIIRDTHNVVLTPAGMVLANGLPQLGTSLSQLVVDAQQANEGRNGKLLLGILDGLLPLPVVSRTMEHIKEEYPGVDIRPVCLQLEEAGKVVHTGEVDMIYSYDTDQPFDDNLDSMTLTTDFFCAAVSEKSPLAQLERANLMDLHREKFYVAGTETSYELHRWRETCAGRGFMPRFVTVPNPGTLVFCVENNFGIALMPSRHQIFQKDGVHQVRLTDDLPLQINLKWNRANNNPCVALFLNALQLAINRERDEETARSPV